MRLRMPTAGVFAVLAFLCMEATAAAQTAAAAPSPRLTLRRLVDPTTRVEVQGRAVRFALHGLIYFDTLADLFAHVDGEAGRWRFPTDAARQAFADDLLRRGVESRVVSMETELPLEVILTHTRAELERAVAATATADAPLVFKGRHWQLTPATYRDAFVRVRDRWAISLNCWSAASSIPGRVLSNWYVIDEGIELFGATYDSTEHFWQAVKFHPDVTVADLRSLLTALMAADAGAWVDGLAADQRFYLANTYAVEFLERNVSPDRLAWFHAELGRVAEAGERARTAQQRRRGAPGAVPRFAAVDEKVLWGDLADVFHLIVAFGEAAASRPSPALAAVRTSLVAHRFDGIYLDGYGSGRVAFLSPEFQALMLEIWKVKFLRHPRLGDVLRSTVGRRLDHFLNDGDSPDIPIPIYVGYLNRIREIALEASP
jgi:hypothetical protein